MHLERCAWREEGFQVIHRGRSGFLSLRATITLPTPDCHDIGANPDSGSILRYVTVWLSRPARLVDFVPSRCMAMGILRREARGGLEETQYGGDEDEESQMMDVDAMRGGSSRRDESQSQSQSQAQSQSQSITSAA